MKYVIDHDLHIHSKLSFCSLNPEQTPNRILQYGLENGFKKICLTDHFWDKDVPLNVPYDHKYGRQNSEYIRQSLPLPEADGIKFLFGGECDMDLNDNIGISDKYLDTLDFLIVPTTHLHLNGFSIDGEVLKADNYKLPDDDNTVKILAERWVERFWALLNADLPFHKVGAAHLTWIPFKSPQSIAKMFDLIGDKTLDELFKKAADIKIGIEINSDPHIEKSLGNSTLRIYRKAKANGCKFYFGSDAHSPGDFINRKQKFQELADWIGLEENDKFQFVNI